MSSDIDLVIVKRTQERFFDRLDTIYGQINPRLSLDLLVYTPEEFEEMKQWSSFVQRILREGRVLYEAGQE